MNGQESGAVEWGYSGPGAPEHWGALAPEYAPCAEGAQQSPIDLTDYETGNAPAASFAYAGAVSGAELARGVVVVSFGPGSGMALGGRRYELKSAHSHAPSEHTVDGEQFAAEMHLVHESEAGEVAVVGVLFRLGAANPVLQAMLDAASGGTPDGFPLAAADFVPRSLAYFGYSGSKTTPPCDEPVEWVVMREPAAASQEQVDALIALSGGPNNRPLQPRRSRRVVLVAE